MNWKRIGRAVLCLLVVCCLVLNMSPIEARAIDPITIGMGIFAGVGALLGIGSIMVGLGVQPQPTATGRSDFWDLADRIFVSLPDEFKMTQMVAGYGMQTLLKSWLYNDTYYFHQEVVEAVNSRLFYGTPTYDEATDRVVVNAPIQASSTFKGQSGSSGSTDVSDYADKALAYLYQYYPNAIIHAANAAYCYYFALPDGRSRVVFCNEPASFVQYDALYYGASFSGENWCVEFSALGQMSAVNGSVESIGCTYYELATLNYSTNLDMDLVQVSRDVSYGRFYITVNGDGDDGPSQPAYVFLPNSIPATKEEVETMTKEDAQSGSIAMPDISVDVNTGEVIDSNRDNSFLLDGVEVGVDVTTAVASILIALGISPGSSNSDFRALVNNVVASLPAEFLYDYDSLATGAMQMLRCWLVDETYYVTEDVLVYINDLLYNGSDTMDPIFSSSGFIVDTAKHPDYSKFISLVESRLYNSAFKELWENASYLVCVYNSSGDDYFAASDEPFKIYTTYNSDGSLSRFQVNLVGNYIYSYTYNGSYRVTDGSSPSSSPFPLCGIGSYNNNTFYYDVYESGLSLVGDYVLSASSPNLSDLGYGYYTVTVDDVAINYYPLKLFETLEEAESATQDEVQAGLNSSTSVTVDTSTGTIIIVVPGIDSGGTDPTEPGATLPYPEFPDLGGDTGSDSGSDTGNSSGSISQNILENLLNTHRSGLLNGLKGYFEWLANSLVSGLTRVAQWLLDNLLAGIAKIFVPTEDFLTSKVQALRSRFSFADSIISTGETIGFALNDFETSPPVIYMELGNAESQYDWGGQAIALDLRWYERYKPTVDRLLSALLWIFFAWRVFRKLPGIISGMEGDSTFAPVSDGQFGGYSSNLPRLGSGSMKRRE